jgi:hypothetical protein
MGTQKQPRRIEKSIGGLGPSDIFSVSMRNPKNALNPAQIKDEMRNWYAFEGPFGEVVLNARYFFAWKEGHLLGTYTTLKEAMESISWGGKGARTK